MKLCSACLLGINCMWDGKSKLNEKVLELSKKEKLIPICPEQLGGLPTPRKPAVIWGGTGKDVLDGNAKVIDKKGVDVTKEFLNGAKKVLDLAKENNIDEAILKNLSPSCGSKTTWQKKECNGKMRSVMVSGKGVAAAYLENNGIKIISEKDL